MIDEHDERCKDACKTNCKRYVSGKNEDERLMQ